MIFSNEIFMIEASKVNEMLENLPLKWTIFVLDRLIFFESLRMRVFMKKLRVETENETRVFLESLDL